VTVLLLLHAFPLDALMWEGQTTVLEQAGYEVVAPNLPGREPDASLGSWAARILELLPGEFVPVGISMGGYLTFELYRQAPGRIPAVVLADTQAGADSEEARAAREESVRTIREDGFDAFWAGLLLRLLALGKPVAALADGEIDEILAFANAMGSLVTTKLGAIAAIPTRDEVEYCISNTPLLS
jgi:pimeloyl-ACP methyl ester carboxylesterase